MLRGVLALVNARRRAGGTATASGSPAGPALGIRIAFGTAAFQLDRDLASAVEAEWAGTPLPPWPELELLEKPAER
jgi:hypothetical protein